VKIFQDLLRFVGNAFDEHFIWNDLTSPDKAPGTHHHHAPPPRLHRFGKEAMLPAAPLPFICHIGPFVGDVYTVRCPSCLIVMQSKHSDGAALRVRPMWKTCDLGHKFLVCLDATPSFDRVAFVDGSDYAYPMEPGKKKPRVGPSRTEQMSVAEKMRHIIGLAAPLETRKHKPPPIHVSSPPPHPPSEPPRVPSPPPHVALAALVAAPVVSARQQRQALYMRDEDEEDIDIDAALRTMDDIAAEHAAGKYDGHCD